MFSSDQTFTINGDTDEALAKVLELGLELSDWKNIEAFYEDKNGLVFCAYECDDSHPYPFEVTIPVLVEQTKQYIKKLSAEDILRLAGKTPDSDGIVNLGWEVFCPSCYGENKIEEFDLAAVLAVRPCWIVYDK